MTLPRNRQFLYFSMLCTSVVPLAVLARPESPVLCGTVLFSCPLQLPAKVRLAAQHLRYSCLIVSLFLHCLPCSLIKAFCSASRPLSDSSILRSILVRHSSVCFLAGMPASAARQPGQLSVYPCSADSDLFMYTRRLCDCHWHSPILIG